MATQNEDTGFSKALKNVGLKPEYWLEIFTKLEIDSVEALEFIDETSEEYPELIKAARKSWEKKALNKLLKIEDNKEEAKESEREKKVKQRLEKSNQTLQKLKELSEKGKQRHDARVQQIEKDVCEQFKISPESWISKDKSLSELINKLETHNERINGVLQTRDGQSDSMVLRNASNGRALHGILLSSDLEVLIKDRLSMLKPPENVNFKHPSKSTINTVETFNMKAQEDTYKKSVDTFGWGVSVSGKAPVFGGVTIEAGVSASSKDKNETCVETDAQNTYLSTVKLSSSQLAAYTFENRDLQLSTDAVETLKKIKTIIMSYGPDSSNVQSACEEFFHNYGSHASRGPLHFGGIYWRTCYSRGFSEKETAVVKELQSNALSEEASVAFMGFDISSEVDITSVKSNYKGKCTQKTQANTYLQVSITGGPPEITSLPEWKTGLVANNKTWSLTDRGTILVPVWEIIVMNYGKELNILVKVIKKCWERLTNLKARQSALTTSYSPEKVLEQVTKWSPDQDLSDIEECLDYLLNVKNDLQQNSKYTRAWSDLYLSEPTLQEFLTSVMDQQEKLTTNSETSIYIKFLMQQIVEQQELNTLKNLPGKARMLEWLYPPAAPRSLTEIECNDFESLLRNLKDIEKSMKIAKAKGGEVGGLVQDYQKVATSKVVLAIHSLRVKILKGPDSERKYDDIFTVTLVYPFLEEDVIGIRPTSPVLLKWLSIDDLGCLCSLLQEQTPMYRHKKTETTPIVQAYLFHLAIAIHNQKEEMCEDQLREHLLYMKKAIGGDMQPQITVALSSYITNHRRLAAFQEELKTIMIADMSPQDQQVIQHGDSLYDLLSSLGKPIPLLSNETDPCKSVQDLSMFGKPEVERLLTVLGLSQYYPKKLTVSDAVCVRQPHFAHSSRANELYCTILHKIMAYDYTCRSKPLEGNFTGFNENLSSQISALKIHPLDGLLAVIHCADDILRQHLMCRLTVCQLGVPFILPDPFTDQLTLPYWAMQSIVKVWKHKTQDGTTIEEECPIISYPTPIISFLRFGKDELHGKSKSKILNEVISDSHFEHFYHRDCDGGRCKRLLCDGLVEMIWYLPGDNTNNIFPNAVTFLNLHGDARKHSRQTALLGQMSSMSFIMLTDEDVESEGIDILKMFCMIPGGVVLLIENSKLPSDVQKSIPNLMTINLSGGEGEIRTEIRECINTSRSTFNSLQSLEKHIEFIRFNNVWDIREIQVDVHNSCLNDGIKLAHSLQKLIIQKHTDEDAIAKDTMLPLQGEDLWHEWAEHNKEQYRQLGRHPSLSPSDYTELMEAHKTTVRNKQLQYVDCLTPVTKEFLKIVLSHDGKVVQHFLLCLKLGLNNNSRKITAELRDCMKDSKYHKKAIEKMYNKLSKMSVGIEHLLRELGQVYEAALHHLKQTISDLPKAVQDNIPTVTSLSHIISDEDIKRLPQLRDRDLMKLTKQIKIFRLSRAAAHFLIGGHPLEIMDGDTAHIPIQWVTSVVNEVVLHLNNPCVFVLSVLGLQSTGKSTMLNTTFGCQFKVSSGRCTRGAYMQLLPVCNEFKKETGCSYILIIDTEGLRAPELLDSGQRQKHDNELATFVIGLANVTLININGEVAGDMEDILQTAVHAFIRMRMVKLEPCCQFIHHNAIKSSKGDLGQQKFVNRLNKITNDVVKEEKCEGEFKKFTDVIKFNVCKDIHYFPGLWMGEPPMAPVSRGYSESALKLKSHLVGLMKNNYITLSTFERKVDNLWDALLHEDFVFSFKNTVEVMAYNKLEVQYNKWSWEFQKPMMIWEEETEKEIDCIDLEMLTAEVDKKLAPNGDLDKEIMIHLQDIEYKMDIHFKTSNQSDTLAQWRQRFEIRLQGLADRLRRHANAACRERETGRKAMVELLDKEGGSRSWIVSQVKAIIVKMKTEQEDLELKKNLEKNQLLMKQLGHMLELLIPEQLEKYIELDILTTKQVNEIHRKVPLTENKLHLLLQTGTISIEQANRILKQGRLNEKQLQNKFDQHWLELLNKLPLVHEEHINVGEDFEVKLYEHLGRKCKDKLNQKLFVKKLKDWDTCKPENVHLTFTVVDKHIKKGFFKKNGASSESVESAQNVTDRTVIKQVKNYLSKTCESKSNDHPSHQRIKPKNFKPSFTQELLRVVDNALCDQGEAGSAFTEDYKLDLYLTVCGHAINRFERMVEDFRKSNNPREYLKDEKDVLFTLFKSQYCQFALEKTVASTLCKVFEKQITEQVKLNLGKTLIDDLRSTYKWFDNKSTLKAKVLLDLGESLSMLGKKQALSDCFEYITNGAIGLKHWLRKHTESHCTAVVDKDGCTRLANLASNEVSHLIHILGNTIREVTSNAEKLKDGDRNVQIEAVAWIEAFLKGKKLIRKLGKVNFDNSPFSDKLLTVEGFMKEITEGLEELKKMLQKYFRSICLKDIDNRPFEILEKTLVGCCELCPFCQEQCDWGEHEDDIKHRVRQHRPDCLGGYNDITTRVMTLNLCTDIVLSDRRFRNESDGMKEYHPYKEYKEIYPQWSIPGDLAAKASSYWKWFTGHYYSEIAHQYGAIEPVVPDAWKNLKWEDVKRDLMKQFNL